MRFSTYLNILYEYVVLLTYITKSTALAAAAVARLMAFAGELLGEGVVTASGPSTVL